MTISGCTIVHSKFSEIAETEHHSKAFFCRNDALSHIIQENLSGCIYVAAVALQVLHQTGTLYNFSKAPVPSFGDLNLPPLPPSQAQKSVSQFHGI